MRNRLKAIGYKESDSASWYTYSFLFTHAINTCPIMKEYYILGGNVMKQQNTNQERKTFKEVVAENKGKIMVIGGAVITIAVGVVLTKNYKNLAKQVVKADAKGDLGILVDDELWCKMEVTENIIANSGIIDQARATISRKRDTLVGKLNCYENMTQLTDDIVNKITETKAGIAGFDKMLDQCEELEYLYNCRTIGENLLEK